jgi:hypothetical protein
MALTLAEAAKLANDRVLEGVIETIVQDSPVLQALPFIEITGNGLTYNRENTNPNATFFDVGDTWTEGTPTFTQITATLKIIGGDADVDNFLLTTRSNVQDLQAAVVRLRAKAVQQKFEDTFINGDTAVDAKSFDGIDKLTTGGQIATMGVNGATLDARQTRRADRPREGRRPGPAHHEQAHATDAEQPRPYDGRFPADGPQRVRPDGPVLRRRSERRLRLHLRREDRRLQQ